MLRLYLLSLLLLLSGCTTVKIKELEHFNNSRYLGKWYEIARLNHPFEKDLIYVTAKYSPLKDGSIQVINRGYNIKNKKWESAKARAVITDKKGQLKVYFIPLIAGNYEIAYLDEKYTTAVVSGGTLNYLWFLSRTPKITNEQLNKMLEVAKSYGYDTDKLIYPPTITVAQ